MQMFFQIRPQLTMRIDSPSSSLGLAIQMIRWGSHDLTICQSKCQKHAIVEVELFQQFYDRSLMKNVLLKTRHIRMNLGNFQINDLFLLSVCNCVII